MLCTQPTYPPSYLSTVFYKLSLNKTLVSRDRHSTDLSCDLQPVAFKLMYYLKKYAEKSPSFCLEGELFSTIDSSHSVTTSLTNTWRWL